MDDLSEYEKARQDAYVPLVDRVHKDWRSKVFIFSISCGLGWKEIVFKLVDELDMIWNGFEGKKGSDCWQICQAKEKVGGLRFYIEYPEGKDEERLTASRKAIEEAEAEAWKTCERCGKPGHLAGTGYVATVCEECEARWNERKARGVWPSRLG